MYVAIWSKHGHGIFSVLHEKNSFVFFLLFCKVNTISDLLVEAVRVESQRGITCLFLLHRLLQVRGILDRHSLDEPPLKRVKRSGVLTLYVSEEAHARLHPPLQTVELRRSGNLDKLLLQRQLEDLEEIFSPPREPVVIYFLS